MSLSFFIHLEIISVFQWLIQSHGLLSDLGHPTLQERVCSAFYSRSHSKSFAETWEGLGRAVCQLSWLSKWHACGTWEYILHEPMQQSCCAMLEETFPSPAVPLVSSRCKVQLEHWPPSQVTFCSWFSAQMLSKGCLSVGSWRRNV